MALKAINIMKDGRVLDSLAGIDAPEVIYDILLKDYRARGVILMPVEPSEKQSEDTRPG